VRLSTKDVTGNISASKYCTSLCCADKYSIKTTVVWSVTFCPSHIVCPFYSHGGQCIPGLIDDFGNEQLFCDCNNAVDEDGNRYGKSYRVFLYRPLYSCKTQKLTFYLVTVGKFCEHQAKVYCDDDERRFCVNDGECNSEYP